MPTAPAADAPARHREIRLPRARRLAFGARPLVMAVVNLTPDSFSDGGVHYDPGDPERAVAAGLEKLAEGADLLDLGAESTRPGGGVYGRGAEEISAEEEIRRLLPVLERLRARTDAPLSVDTRKGEVARAALDAGADLINDVSALGDPDLGAAVAASGCPIVLMHSRGPLETMQKDIRFQDVVAEVRAELRAALARAEAAGIDPEQTIVDPGIGFGKSLEHNLRLIGRLSALADLGRPILLGASRKSFLGALTGEPPAKRLAGSLAAAGWGALSGADILRVHDVRATASFLRVLTAIREAGA